MSPSAVEQAADRFRALRHRNFRLYWSGQLVSLVGTWMQAVAQGWLMHRLTSSPFMLGLLAFMQFFPVLLFSLFAGVIADRVDKRRMLLVTQTLAFLQAVTMALVVTTGVVTPQMVLVLAFLYGTFTAFDLPARQSFLVELVGKEDLTNAIALNSAAFNTARITGPAIAGLLVAWIGEAGCFWVNAVSFIAVLTGLSMIRLDPKPHTPAWNLGLEELKEGIRYAFSLRPIRNLLLLLGVASGLGFQYTVLLPVYTRDILTAGPETFGLLVSAFGVGSLLSAIIMTRRLDRPQLRRNLLIGLTTAGIGMTVFAWSRSLPLSLVAGFLAGFGLILYVSSTNTMLQLTTEDRFRGRIMSLYTLFFVGTAPAGAILCGTVAQHFGAPWGTTICGVVLFGGALWVWYRMRVLAAQAASPPVPPQVEKVG